MTKPHEKKKTTTTVNDYCNNTLLLVDKLAFYFNSNVPVLPPSKTMPFEENGSFASKHIILRLNKDTQLSFQ